MTPRHLIFAAAILMLSAANALAADRFVYESKKFQDVLGAGKPVRQAALQYGGDRVS